MNSSHSPKSTGVIANAVAYRLAAIATATAALAAACVRTQGQVLMEMMHSTVLGLELSGRFAGRLAIRSMYSDGRKTLRQTGMPERREISHPQADSVPVAWLASDLEGASNASRTTTPPRCAFSILALAPPNGMATIDTRQYVNVLALPRGVAKLPYDAPADLIVEQVCNTFQILPREIEATALLRDENAKRAREFEAAGATVRLIPNGTFEAFAEAVAPVEPGAPVRIAFGRSGALEAMLGAFVAKSTRGHLVAQPLDASGQPTGPSLDVHALVISDDVLLAAACLVSPRDGAGLLEGLRRSDACGRAWVKVFVSSPELGKALVHYVASFFDGELEALTQIEPGQSLDAYLLSDYLAKNGSITSSIPDGEAERFHHEPCVPGFEGRDLVRALNDACEAGYIVRDSQFPGPDSSLERITYSCL